VSRCLRYAVSADIGTTFTPSGLSGGPALFKEGHRAHPDDRKPSRAGVPPRLVVGRCGARAFYLAVGIVP